MLYIAIIMGVLLIWTSHIESKTTISPEHIPVAPTAPDRGRFPSEKDVIRTSSSRYQIKKESVDERRRLKLEDLQRVYITVKNTIDKYDMRKEKLQEFYPFGNEIKMKDAQTVKKSATNYKCVKSQRKKIIKRIAVKILKNFYYDLDTFHQKLNHTIELRLTIEKNGRVCFDCKKRIQLLDEYQRDVTLIMTEIKDINRVWRDLKNNNKIHPPMHSPDSMKLEYDEWKILTSLNDVLIYYGEALYNCLG